MVWVTDSRVCSLNSATAAFGILFSANLSSLETLRLRSQLIVVFQILFKFDKIDPILMFWLSEIARTKNHDFKLELKLFHAIFEEISSCRKSTFSEISSGEMMFILTPWSCSKTDSTGSFTSCSSFGPASWCSVDSTLRCSFGWVVKTVKIHTHFINIIIIWIAKVIHWEAKSYKPKSPMGGITLREITLVNGFVSAGSHFF